MIQLRVKNNRIYAFVPFKMKETVKRIPGAKWNKTFKAWVFPASSETAENLMKELFDETRLIFDHTGEYIEIDSSEKFKSYVNMNIRKKENAVVKTRDDLENIPGLKLNAWNHQRQAYWFTKDLFGAGLFMDMGTGKTMTTISLIINRGHEKILVVCPKSVIDTWPEEFEKHVPEDTTYKIIPLKQNGVAKKIEVLKKEMALADVRGEKVVVVINYESAWRKPMDKTLIDAGFDCVVADEVHRIKSPGGKSSMFMSRLADAVPYRIGLSGTPMPHSPLDVYGIYRFLDKGVFGTSFNAFKSRYAIMGGYGGYEVKGYQNEDELHEKVYSVAYRVKKDVLDLPDQVFNRRSGELSKKAQKIYDEIEQNFYAKVDEGEITVTNALSKLLRLQQITSGYLPQDDNDELLKIDDGKKEMLKDIFEDLPADEPVVVFARFTKDLENVREIAEKTGRTYAELSGQENHLKEWKDGEYNVIGVQIQAGGSGVNLSRSRYNIYYSLGFSLEQYEQSLSRSHRPGQTRETIYYHLIMKNTVDEKVFRALKERKKVVDSILNDRK